MPASALGPLEIIQNFSEAYIQKRYRKDGVTESTLYKLCRAVSVGFLQETGEAIDLLEPQRFDLTAQEGFLDNRADFWNVPRRVEDGETDASLRLRIGLVKLVKWGAFNVDDMLSLLATLLQTDATNVSFTENEDENGDFEPALITFNVSPAVFITNGITDVAGAVEDLQADMEKVAPAGVRVIVSTSGNAQYDSGDQYDSGVTYS